MNLQPVVDAVGWEGLILMAVCFAAVAWWGLKRPGGDGGEEGGDGAE